MDAKLETGIGAVVFFLSLISHIAHDIMPFISFVGGLCGMILGLHGIWVLARQSLRKEKNKND